MHKHILYRDHGVLKNPFLLQMEISALSLQICLQNKKSKEIGIKYR